MERDQSVQVKLRYGSGQGIYDVYRGCGECTGYRWCEGRTVIGEVYIGFGKCTGG